MNGMDLEPVIGIDLGTTKSCVAVYQHGEVKIIESDQGYKVIPSYVAFTENQRLIGDAAKNQAAINPTNTVFDSKRLIGRRFDDPTVQSDIKRWPFNVVNDNGKPKIEVEYKGDIKRFDAEQISSMVLSKMKETAEAYLGKTVTRAVVTVPDYFNDSQRQATKDAALIAGLEVWRILPETAAAALAYRLGRNESVERNVLIFDLGGGTFDVSVLNISDVIIEVRSTAGDTHLGGEDFSTRLLDYFCKKFEKEHSKDLTTDKKSLRRLRNACENVKRTLSTNFEGTIEIGHLFEGIDFNSKITRALFEELNKDLFDKVLQHVENVIKDAKVDKSEMHDVVLVGGSSRIPKVRKLLEDFFVGKKLNHSINPDEAMAYGAAVEAAILTGDVKDLLIIPVTPITLGIELPGGEMEILLKRNSVLPNSRKNVLKEYTHNQQCVLFQVFEGECCRAKDNNLLGNFILRGIPLEGDVIEIQVTCDVDFDGIMTISNVDTGTDNKITIESDKGRLSREEIEKRIEEFEHFKYEDSKHKAKAEAKHALEAYAFGIKSTVEVEMMKVVHVVDNTLKWLETNPNASTEEIENMEKELKGTWDKTARRILYLATGTMDLGRVICKTSA